MRLIDLTGQRLGRLTVLHRVTGKGWLCRCDCGAEKIVTSTAVKSCGCLKSEMISRRNRTHGRTGTPEHNSWLAMRQRCYYRQHKDYSRYGGRGIKVCAKWRDDFEAFLADVGARPSPQHTIDRIDGNGDYEPGNVRWSNAYVQSGNRSNVISVTLDDGREVTLKRAAQIYGADYGAVRHAINYSTRKESPLDACKRLGRKIHHKTGPRKLA